MPSILIVDQHLLIRLGLRQMLSEEIRGLVFGEAKSSDEALVRLTKQPWDLVILAIALPGMDDGFSVLKQMRSLNPSPRVLVLSAYADAEHVLQARQLGASGYVSKKAGRAELLKAVRAVLAGREYFEDLPPSQSNGNAPRHSSLSAREYQVLLAIVAGKRPSEIAAEHNLSGKTVATYKRRVLDKLGLRSTSDLVHYAIKHHLS